MPIADEGKSGLVRVVIVDDSDDIRLLFRTRFARDQRFEVVGDGSDGHEAIEQVTVHRPDVLILDHMMPNLSGIDAIPEIKARSPETLIVLCTSHADVARDAYEAGALEVIKKDAIQTVLLDRLVKAARSSHREAYAETRSRTPSNRSSSGSFD